MFRALNAVMAALFALAAVVQYNDPDPARWILVYGLAAFLSARVAAGKAVYVPGALALGFAACGWAAALLATAPGPADLDGLLEFRTMRSTHVEIAREVVGLGIVSAWMLAHVLRAPARRAG